MIKPMFFAQAFLSLTAATCLLASPAQSQTAVPKGVSAPSISAAPAPYKSVFDQYQAHTDEPIADWKAANATAARIGGWREYAKQAQGIDSQPETTPTTGLTPKEAMRAPVEKAKP